MSPYPWLVAIVILGYRAWDVSHHHAHRHAGLQGLLPSVPVLIGVLVLTLLVSVWMGRKGRRRQDSRQNIYDAGGSARGYAYRPRR